jgi:hypothetical protein
MLHAHIGAVRFSSSMGFFDVTQSTKDPEVFAHADRPYRETKNYLRHHQENGHRTVKLTPLATLVLWVTKSYFISRDKACAVKSTIGTMRA